MTKYDKIMIAMLNSRFSRKILEKSGILIRYRYNLEYYSKIGDISL